jgi:hypothetical protein
MKPLIFKPRRHEKEKRRKRMVPMGNTLIKRGTMTVRI